MQAYMQKLGSVLLDCNAADAEAPKLLSSVLLEAASLYVCLEVYNTETLKQVLSSRMDTGKASGDEQLDDGFYTQLLVSSAPAQLRMVSYSRTDQSGSKHLLLHSLLLQSMLLHSCL